ncbi:MAG: hypothetical protein JXB39_04970 [Deltaproteobacteria bacterium]|nr:hypothetical protein [Deltaproteobacteria bacterium]
MLVVAAVLLALAPALAYETDPFTGRERPIPDARAVANARADAILARAIARTNVRTGCSEDDATTRRILARSIERQTDPDRLVLHRGPIRALGYSSYSGWMETDPDVPVLSVPFRDNLFSEIRFFENVILWLVGPCATVRMGNVWVGTDKFDHFWDLGWVLYREGRDGADPEAALLRSLRSESGFRGYRSSGGVSYADLRANYDGYRFYSGLLGEDSIVQRGPDGCLVKTRPWDWMEYVDRDWDEFLNPSNFTPAVRRAIDRALEGQDDRICALDAAGRSAPPSRVPLETYLAVDRLEAADGRLRSGLRERIDPFRRAERCEKGQ